MWVKKLDEIKKVKALFHEEVNNGASSQEISLFKNAVKKSLNKDIPKEYLDALTKVNGVEFNGFILYGIDEVFLEKSPNQHINGLVEFNQIWYENEYQVKYLFLGESNISWYVFCTEDEKFKELDNPSGRECKIFETFGDLFENLLSESLL